MIAPLDRSRRDSTRSQVTTRQLRDFIDPNHLLIRIDERLDFAKLVAPWKTATVSSATFSTDPSLENDSCIIALEY
jgi:hypothetical protein